jgi:tRNA threonylcarbamoyladenosine biosynthesis protein TsaB
MARVITLALEASTYAGSVAVLDGDRMIGERSVAMRGREHEALMPAVAGVLSDCALTPADVGRVVCGAGPGAFTSLRVAGAIAKGVAFAASCPLVPVSSLALLVASQEPLSPGRRLAAVDAMRGEHYVQLFDVSGDLAIEAISGISILATSAVRDHAAAMRAEVVGPSGDLGTLVTPHARGFQHITNVIEVAEPADLAAWEPGYGRLAEAQVKWEAQHGRPLKVG